MKLLSGMFRSRLSRCSIVVQSRKFSSQTCLVKRQADYVAPSFELKNTQLKFNIFETITKVKSTLVLGPAGEKVEDLVVQQMN